MLEDFLWPGEWLVDLLAPAFEWLKEDDAAPSLAVWMLYVAFALWLFHLAWVVVICASLKHRRKVIEDLTEETISNALPIIKEHMERRFRLPSGISAHLPEWARPGRKGRFRFMAGMNTFTRNLRHAWNEFDETLIKPEPDDPHPIVWNTARPQTFFNAAAVGLRFRFFGALPGIFVGVGLLLTFFGLVSALYFATQGIGEGSSVAETQEALKGLLRAASFKFYTSIAGLLASMWFVVWLRIGARYIDGAFEKFSKALEERLQFATPESKTFQLADLAEKQHEELQRLNTDIAVAIGQRVEEALNSTLPTHLSEPLQSLSARLEHVAGNLNNMNVDALKSMGHAFNQELLGATQGQFQELAVVLSDLKASLGGMKERMDESGSQLAQNVRDSTGDIRAAMEAVTEAVNQMASNLRTGAEESNDAMERQIAALNERLEQVSETLAARVAEIGSQITERAGVAGNEAVAIIAQSAQALRDALANAAEEFERVEREIAAHREAIHQIAEGTGTAGEAAQTAAKSFQEAAGPLSAVARDIARAAGDTRTATQNAVDAIQLAQRQIQQTGDHLSQAAEKSRQSSERFSGVDESLGKILQDLVNTTQQAIEHIQNYVTQLDGLFSASIDRLAGGVEGLEQIAESLEETARTRK